MSFQDNCKEDPAQLDESSTVDTRSAQDSQAHAATDCFMGCALLMTILFHFGLVDCVLCCHQAYPDAGLVFMSNGNAWSTKSLHTIIRVNLL